MPLKHAVALALMLAGASSAIGQRRSDLPEPSVAPPEPIVVLGAPVPAEAAKPMGAPYQFDPPLPTGTPTEQITRDLAQPVSTLSEALTRAYWTNPQLLAQRAQVRAADYLVPQARSAYGPELQYSVSRAYAYDRTDISAERTVTRSGWTNTATAVLNQPLFTFGRLRANEDLAYSRVDFEGRALDSREQETMLRAIGAYVAVLRERAAVGIGASQVDLLTRQFNDTAIRLGARDSTSADLQQIQSRLEFARAELAGLEGERASSSATFLQIIGAPPGDLAAPNPLTIPVQSIEDAYVYAEARNPVVRAAYARERASRAQLNAAKADRYPRIDLRGSVGRAPLSPYNDSLRQNELRGAITLSGAIDSGGRQARVDELRALNDSDWRLIDQALRENRQEIADAWNSWKTGSAAVASLVVAVDAAEKAYLGGREQERAGFRTTTEVLDLARDLLNARSNLNNARGSVIIAQARLLAAMGALGYSTLLPEEPNHDPREHFERVKGDADFPLIAPAVRALDSLMARPPRDRPVRDPAEAIGAGEVSHPPDQAAR